MILFRLRTCPLVLSDEQTLSKGFIGFMTRVEYRSVPYWKFTIFGIEIIVKRIRIFYKNKTFNL